MMPDLIRLVCATDIARGVSATGGFSFSDQLFSAVLIGLLKWRLSAICGRLFLSHFVDLGCSNGIVLPSASSCM